MKLSKRLGHASITTTLDTFSHLYPDTQKSVASIFDDFEKKPPDVWLCTHRRKRSKHFSYWTLLDTFFYKIKHISKIQL